MIESHGDEWRVAVDEGSMIADFPGLVPWPMTDRFFRYASYWWFWKRVLQLNNTCEATQDNMPACIVDEVRRLYPDKDGQYSRKMGMANAGIVTRPMFEDTDGLVDFEGDTTDDEDEE